MVVDEDERARAHLEVLRAHGEPERLQEQLQVEGERQRLVGRYVHKLRKLLERRHLVRGEG